MDSLADNLNEATHFISKKLTASADAAVVLGSGLGDAASMLEPEAELEYGDISHFPVSGISGHKGKMLFCRVGQKTVLVLQGRFHYYEGYTMRGVTFPIRVLGRLGVKSIVLTNAAGGLNRRFKPGAFMLINDQLNFMGDNPLIGIVDKDGGAPFVDMRRAFDQDLIELALEIAKKKSIAMHKGVLAGVSGPSYETAAEARWLQKCGADAVTMSTVPEVIVARHCGMRVLGLSCITNSLWQSDKIGHGEVVGVGRSAARVLAPWLSEVLRKM